MKGERGVDRTAASSAADLMGQAFGGWVVKMYEQGIKKNWFVLERTWGGWWVVVTLQGIC
jgi:hypothetical protein